MATVNKRSSTSDCSINKFYNTMSVIQRLFIHLNFPKTLIDKTSIACIFYAQTF